MCETCQKKVNLTKKESISKLPNVLLIHLQRITFNYEFGINEKIDTRLEFPNHLNMKPYTTEDYFEKNKRKAKEPISNQTQENLEEQKEAEKPAEKKEQNPDENIENRIYMKNKSYYEYHLVGILVHTGHADAGHYFSFINTKRNGSGNKMNFNVEKDFNNFINFNDSSITSYNTKDIEQDCFGGTSTTQETTGFTAAFSWLANDSNKKDVSVSKSAYILVYERIQKSGVQLVLHEDEKDNYIVRESGNNENLIVLKKTNKFSLLKEYDICRESVEAEIREGISKKVFYDEELNEYFHFKDFYDYECKIQSQYYKEVEEDNNTFINDQQIYTSEFSNFVEKLIKNLIEMTKEKRVSLKVLKEYYPIVLNFLFFNISKSNFKEVSFRS